MKQLLISLVLLAQASSAFGMLKNFQVDGTYGPSGGGTTQGGGGVQIPIGSPQSGPSPQEKKRLEIVADQRRDAERLNAQATSYLQASTDAVQSISSKLTAVKTKITSDQTSFDSTVKFHDEFQDSLKNGTYERYDPSKSPSLQRSYPELVLVPLLQRAMLPLSESIVEIGTAVANYRDIYDYPRIETPWIDEATGSKWAAQDLTAEGLAIRDQVAKGALLFKLGKRGISETGKDAQFYSLRNPQTFEGFGPKHAMPARNFTGADFVERATMKNAGDFIVRRIGKYTDKNGEVYPGGEWEIVVPKSGTHIRGHSSL